jgi:hypothetical protein
MAPRASFLVIALALAMPAIADDAQPAEQPAAWTLHEVSLVYMGFTTRYSCSGLKSKVKLLLKHMGVREDIRIRESGCEFGYEKVADVPRLKIAFYAPTIPKPGEKVAGEPVLGVWKPIVIRKNSPRGLDMGDCELVEAFRDRVLPKFLVRSVEGDINCIPHQLVGNRIDLRFEVLTGIRPVDEAEALGARQDTVSRDD